MELRPIGCIHSSYKTLADAPRQGRWSEEIVQLEIYAAYEDGLLGIGKHQYLIILYEADRADHSRLQAIPCGGTAKTGVFSCRTPNRPNPILFCVAELIDCQGRFLTVRGVEALDGSPLLDIKPYIAALDGLPTQIENKEGAE